MALDTKHKRGSAVGVGLPYRQWLAEPDGTLADTDRTSLVKLCGAVAPSSPAGGVARSVFASAVFSSRVVRAVVGR